MMLNWGAGPVLAPRWVNSDREDYGQEHVGELLSGLPWPDKSFDAAVTNHALQMVPYHDLVPALTELRRVLKDGAVLRILVPDLLVAMRAYLHDDAAHFLVADDVEPTLDGKLCAYLTWYSTARSVFTRSTLVQWCERAGFSRAEVVGPGQTLAPYELVTSLDSRENESIIVDALR